MKNYMLIPSLIVALLLCCTVNGQPNQQTNSQNTVIISGFLFQPNLLNVQAGTNVTWYNQDSVSHTVTSDTNAFSSGDIAPGKSFTYRFTSPGSYTYHCSIHPTMQGTIVVSSPGKSMLKSMSSGTVIQESSQADTIQGNSGATPNSKQSHSWSEMPLNGQVKMKGGAQQTTALRMNLNQNLGQGLGQTVNLNASQNYSKVLRYSQYYKITPQTPNKPLSSPTKYELNQEPVMLYFGGSGSQKALSYTQYQSYAMYAGMNALWILGPTSWTQYAAVPQGASLSLLAISPTGGYGYLYEIYPDGTLDKSSNYFYPYDQIDFYADEIGQHLLMFVIDGQPSNIVSIDVIDNQPYPPTPPVYNYASITVSSNWLTGYSVYVDNSYMATEGTTGEASGVLSIAVPGDQYHSISVQGSGFMFSDYKYFNAGSAYTLNI